jgi:hypothetical protein
MHPITRRSLAGTLPPPPSAEEVITYGTAREVAADLRNDRRVIILLRIEFPPMDKSILLIFGLYYSKHLPYKQFDSLPKP